MGRKLDFSGLSDLFEAGKDFELTATEYEVKVGKALPKSNNYIKSNSAIATEAKSKGYIVEVTEEPVILRKLIFKKKYI